MYVNLGNASAVEGYRDPDSDDPELLRYRPLDGQHTTQCVFPEGWTLQQAFTDSVILWSCNSVDGSKPVWIESDSDGLERLLKEHFGLPPDAKKPKDWGHDIDVPDLEPPGRYGPEDEE